MDNVKTMRIIIEAFKAGNIDLVLSHVAEGVDWEYGSARARGRLQNFFRPCRPLRSCSSSQRAMSAREIGPQH
jgi:hypothetical protein